MYRKKFNTEKHKGLCVRLCDKEMTLIMCDTEAEWHEGGGSSVTGLGHGHGKWSLQCDRKLCCGL